MSKRDDDQRNLHQRQRKSPYEYKVGTGPVRKSLRHEVMLIFRNLIVIQSSVLKYRCMRAFHNYPPCHRSLDVLAAFRRPAKLQPATTFQSNAESLESGGRSKEPFEQVSAEPVEISFQKVQPTNAALHDQTHNVDSVPAMKDISLAVQQTEARQDNREHSKEIKVQGVVIPPKPRTPGEEGKQSLSNATHHELTRHHSQSAACRDVFTAFIPYTPTT